MIIYADDTSFSKDRDSGNEFVGIGCLLLQNDNTQEIITEAMNHLSSDPDIHLPENKLRDERTMQRAYFHATDDSKNAHSHLCRQINDKLCGDFQYSYSTLGSNNTKEKAWIECLQYIGILISQSRDPVSLIIEQRGSVSKEIVFSVFEEVYQSLNLGSYDYYAIPKFFPKINFSIVDKKSSGIQIVDFLIWAKNRTHFTKPDKTWESRLIFTSKSSTGPFLGTFSQGDLAFKRGVRKNTLDQYPKEIFPLPEFSGPAQIDELFISVINCVLSFLFKDSNKGLQHIRDRFEVLRHTIQKNYTNVTSSEIEGLSICYLWIFDTMPVYANLSSDIENFRKLILSKRLCALVLRRDLSEGVKTRLHLERVFKNLIIVKGIILPEELCKL